MTDWRDPVRVVADYFALVKFVHVLGGLYIWEIVLNLHFEYSVLTGKHRFTRTFPLYLGCRWCPLFAIALQFLGFDVGHEIDCQALVIMTFTFAYLSFLFASALVVLRIYALWERNVIVFALSSILWFVNTISFTYSAITSRGHWTGSFCMIQDTLHTRISIFSTFVTDLVLLSLMLVGVMRWKDARRSGGLSSLLYAQGLAWVVVFTLAELPPVVFIIMNLNDPLNLMFLDFAMIVMSFGTSRMYRGLVEYPLVNSVPSMAADTEKRASEERRLFPCPSSTIYLAEGAHSAENVVSDSSMLPRSSLQDYSGAHEGDGDTSSRGDIP